MSTRFSDKVALVTGGGSGIGRTTALAFAREGATVVVVGHMPESLAESVRQIEDAGGRADSVVADVTRDVDMERVVETIVERHGGLHVAFNNAGILGVPGPLAELDEAIWNSVVATNLTGVWLSMKHQITHMRANGGGVIVNMASNVGAHGRLPGMGAYAATKAGVSALTRTAAREYIADGIRINAISPGPVDAPMSRAPGESDAEREARLAPTVPARRLGRAEEVAATVLWLASPESGYIVGHDVVVDGGVTA